MPLTMGALRTDSPWQRVDFCINQYGSKAYLWYKLASGAVVSWPNNTPRSVYHRVLTGKPVPTRNQPITTKQPTTQHTVAAFGKFDARLLEPNDPIDCQDPMGDWYVAKVVEKVGDDKIKVHYEGYYHATVWSSNTLHLLRRASHHYPTNPPPLNQL